MDLDDHELTLFERDPEAQVDFGGAVFHPQSNEMLATVYVGDRARIYPEER